MNFPLFSAPNLLRVLFVLIILTSSLILLKKASSSAPPAQKLQQAPAATRRLFENRVPEHLPIKVKIKREKEKSFRDLDNENWARDLELEVKNVGDKPIYSMFFYLLVPAAKIGDSYQAFSLVYGRAALSDLTNLPSAEDVPIMPGETKVLTIEDTQLRGWDDARGAGKVPKIRGVRLIFQDLSFGDGTGFEGTSGSPRSKRNNNHYTTEGAGGALRESYLRRGGGPANDADDISLAGNIEPAFFVAGESDLSVSGCCVNDTCEHGYWQRINSD